MTEQLLRFNFRQKYLVLDAETNSLNLTNTLPWQIAWITCEGKNITGEFERKVLWPDYQMSDQIAVLNHFDRSQYEKEARDPLEVLNELWDYICNPEYIIVGQNLLGYDIFVLNAWRKKLGMPTDYSYVNRVLDTKALEMAIVKESKSPPKDDLICWQHTWLTHREKGVKTTQAHMLKKYGIEHDLLRLHSAIYDVKMTFEILKKQLWLLEI